MYISTVLVGLANDIEKMGDVAFCYFCYLCTNDVFSKFINGLNGRPCRLALSDLTYQLVLHP